MFLTSFGAGSGSSTLSTSGSGCGGTSGGVGGGGAFSSVSSIADALAVPGRDDTRDWPRVRADFGR